MSTWIKEIGQKAENVLNKIDQNAAVALQVNEPTPIYMNIEEIKKQARSASTSPRRHQHENTEEDIEKSRRESVTLKTDSVDLESGLPTEDHTKFPNYKIEKELAAYKIALADVTSEKDDLKEELSRIENQKEELYKKDIQINELSVKLQECQDEKVVLEKYFIDLKATNSAQNKVIAELESSLVKIRQEYLDLNGQLLIQKREISQKSIEFENYKRKAQTSLQEKDHIINSIKNPDGNASPESTEFNILKIEFESLKTENAKLEEEFKFLESRNEKLKVIAENQKISFDKKSIDWHNLERKLRETIKSEQTKALQFESEYKALSHELAAVREEMESQRAALKSRLSEKEEEIRGMRLNSSNVSSNAYSTDSRIRSLTETLVEKQNAVEVLTAEKNAMKMQLENMESQIHMLRENSKRNVINDSFINLNDTDDAKAQLPHIMRETPFDNRVARRMKRAYSSLDSAGIRIGRLLRQYPLIRSFAFIYIAFLHLWVMFVLLSSTPSI